MAKKQPALKRNKRTPNKEENSTSIISEKGMCFEKAKEESLKNKAAE
ncbi:MAG: hypothetical protein PHO01_10890 [Desulfotomaculaceae bacterium]|nr:hypothetical protein [Desulfotomaculaceae bacterium]